MLTYALGRGLEYYDKCAVNQITRRLAREHYKFSVLMTEVAKSTPFQMSTVRNSESQAASEEHAPAAAKVVKNAEVPSIRRSSK